MAKTAGANLQINGSQAVSELDKLQKEFDELSKKQKEFTRGSADYANVSKEINTTRSRMTELRKELGTTGLTFSQLQRQARELSKELKTLTPGTQAWIDKTKELGAVKNRMTEVNREIKNIEVSVQKSQNTFQNFTRGLLLGIGSLLGAAGFAGLASAIRGAVQINIEFEASLSRLRAITNATAGDMTLLKNTALEMGRTTQFSATEAADALTFLGMAGFSAANAVAALPGVLNLAASTGMDLARTADITSNVLSSFGLAATESGRVADVLAKTTSSANVNMEQLAEAMKYIAPNAAALKVPIEEVAAFVGVLGDNGIQGSIATASLNTALLNLAKPTKEAKDTMQQLGIQMFDNEGKFIGLNGMIGEVETATANLSDQQRTAAISAIFGANASGQIIAAMNSQKQITIDLGNAKQIELLKSIAGEEAVQNAIKGTGAITLQGAAALTAYTQVMNDASGTAEAMAKIMNDNLAGDLKTLNSAYEGLILEGQGFNSFLRQGTQLLTNMVNSLGSFFNALSAIPQVARDNQVSIAALVIAMVAFNAQLLISTVRTAAYNIAMGLWRAGTIAVTLAQRGLTLAMKANPIGFVIGLIASLVAGLAAAYQNSEAFRNTINALWAAMVQLGKIVVQIAQDLANWDFSAARERFANAGQEMSDAYNNSFKEAEAKAASDRRKEYEAAWEADNKKKRELRDKELKEKEAKDKEEAEKAAAANQEANQKRDAQNAAFAAAAKARRQKEIEALKLLEDLRVQNIADATEREIAQLTLKTSRKLEKIREEGIMVQELTAELEAQRDAKIKEIQDKRAAGDAAKAKAAKDKEIADKLTGLDELYAAEQAKIEEQYLLDQIATAQKYVLEDELSAQRFEELALIETERKNAQLTAEQDFLNRRLEILRQSGQGETIEAQNISNRLLSIEQESNQKRLEDAQRVSDLKKSLQDAEAQLLGDFIDLGIQLLSKDEESKKKYAKTIKLLKKGDVILSLATEIQGIWENAQKNPLNAIIPGWGTAFAAVQTGLASARAGFAISKINSTEFAKGGVLPGRGGLPDGSSHSRGGISLIDNATGEHRGEIEGREPILSRATYQNNRGIVDALLSSSMYQGGAPITGYYEAGGMLPGASAETAQVSARFSAGPSQDNAALIASQEETQKMIAMLIQKIDQKSDAFKKAYISIFELEEQLTDIQKTREDNSSKM